MRANVERPSLRILATLVAGLVLAGNAPSIVIQGNEFQRFDRSEPEFRPIGRIVTDNVRYHGRPAQASGTAFLIYGECQVLTAYHVVFADLDPRTITEDRMKRTVSDVYFGRGGGAYNRRAMGYFDSAVKAHPVAYTVKNERSKNQQYDGWVLLDLDRCVDQRYGFYKLSDSPFDFGAQPFQLDVAGYGFETDPLTRRNRLDFSRDIWGRRNCSGYVLDDFTLGTNCPVRDGGSGGPLIWKNPRTGANVVVGLLLRSVWSGSAYNKDIGAMRDDGSGRNEAISLYPFYRDILKYVKHEGMVRRRSHN